MNTFNQNPILIVLRVYLLMDATVHIYEYIVSLKSTHN